MDRQALSDALGSASFVVWLFAQSPQLYENYKNKSCQGLSAIFLVQWMLGDATNLIGSVLTHQLFFQVAVATYFCCVDVCILLQYYHYWKRDRRIANERKRLARRYEYRSRTWNAAPPIYGQEAITQQPSERGVSVQSRDPPSSLGRLPSVDRWQSHSQTAVQSGARRKVRRSLTQDLDHNYRALGEAAKSVAQLASETERRLAEREARHRWAWRMAIAKTLENAGEGSGKSHGRRPMHGVDEGQDATDDEGDPVPSHMTASTLSTSSHDEEHGFTLGSASTPNLKSNTLTDSPPPSPILRRGRGMQRMAGIVEAAIAEDAQRRRGQDVSDAVNSVPSSPIGTRGSLFNRPSMSRSSTRASIASLSRKHPGMVLLGIAALFTWGGRSGESRRMDIDHSVVGKGNVLSPLLEVAHPVETDTRTLPGYLTFVANAHPASHRWLLEQHGPPPRPPPDWERIIGRTSAWSCTVLYMTSRLPQIWTNMQRKSVQGLSIMLFIAAATGNALYTLSVLLSPRAQSPPNTPEARSAFLMESLPFLLGSGGTLLFDAMIVMQWCVWRGNAPLLDPASIAASGASSTNVMTSTAGSLQFLQNGSRSRKSSTRSRWQSLERQPLL